uniref:Uncharacterized protein n=1 Tax=Setaria viridis TaxID=4556 RepID=A0A4U6UDA5_SETVI|nr:hypothetical protein SEVIR_6G024600v2 [Setaria viridis]
MREPRRRLGCDFDYSQSGILSPLNKVPRGSSAPASHAGGVEAEAAASSTDFLIANPKRRARAGGCRLKDSGAGGKSRASRRFHWRVLKAAIKKFKARQRRSRQAPLLQMMLPML